MVRLFKTFKAFVVTGIVMMLLNACSGKVGCSIEGNCTDPNYQMVMLRQLDGKDIASAQVSGNAFSFAFDKVISHPYICEMLLVNVNDKEDYVAFPVGIENGTVKVTYGKMFKISGTPLNNKIYTFFSGLNDLRESLSKPDSQVALSDINNEFSHYYCKCISLNFDNPLGQYIFDRYGVHLQGDDKSVAEQSLNKQ